MDGSCLRPRSSGRRRHHHHAHSRPGVRDTALTKLFHQAGADESVRIACLTEVARRARAYDAYLHDLATTSRADTDIVALCIAGVRNRVTKSTERLPLHGADRG
ncbi:DUF2000 family protein [Saccharopolyspora tripterygii]